MGYDARQALPEGYALVITEEQSGNSWTGTVGEEIGRGGSCLVYRGVLDVFVGPERVTRPVIIKEFYPKVLDGPLTRAEDGGLVCPEEARAEFEKRLSAFCAGQAGHILFSSEHAAQALPPLFASGRANGTFYAVSGPGQGVSMDRLDRGGLTLTRALRLMASVSDAVHSVHRSGMRLYLDLKPANIYVDGEQAFLFDFDTVQPRERIRYCSCSYGWSAPEQEIAGQAGYRSAAKIGFHTDIYAVAAVFFYLLTGRKPSETELGGIRTPEDWKKLITLDDPAGALENGPFLSELHRVMRAALEPDPDRRAVDYGGSQAALKIKNEWEALAALADSVPARRALAETKAAADEAKASVEAARASIEETVRRYSLREFLFGSARRTTLTAAALVLLTAAVCAAAILFSRPARTVFSRDLFRDEVGRHMVMTLENGSHSYELGLENWRRLDYPRAERDLLAARDELSAGLPADDPELAKVSNSLGCLYLDMGKYEPAYDCLNSAYVVFRDKKGENAAETMAVLFSVAQYDYLTGDPETAQKTLARILERMDTAAHPGAAACVLLDQARIHAELGKYEEARADYQQALSLYEDILKDGVLIRDLTDYANDAQLTENEKDRRQAAVLWIVRTWTAMAENELEAGDVRQAEQLLEQALETCVSDVHIGRKNLVTSRVCLGLARAYQALGKKTEALDTVDLAMRIQLNLFNFEEEYPGLTEVYGVYGSLLTEDGNLPQAEEKFEKALALAQSAYGPNHALTAKAWDQTGLYREAAGDPAGAAEAFARAVEIRRNILGYRHPETVRYLTHLTLAARSAGQEEEALEAAREAKRLCELLGLQGEGAEAVKQL